MMKRELVSDTAAKVLGVPVEASAIFTQFDASNLEVPGVQACLAV